MDTTFRCTSINKQLVTTPVDGSPTEVTIWNVTWQVVTTPTPVNQAAVTGGQVQARYTVAPTFDVGATVKFTLPS